MPPNRDTSFHPWTGCYPTACHWPTRNRTLFASPETYFAQTPANAHYGLPGWTRDCGKRFHRGCDISPIAKRPGGPPVALMFTDCTTGQEYPSVQPTWIPDDQVFAVAAGTVEMVETDPFASTLGCHVILLHPDNQATPGFRSLYAHLDKIVVTEGMIIRGGTLLANMGQTSASADAGQWMAAFPHLHLEIHRLDGTACDPVEWLRMALAHHAQPER